MSLTIKPLHPLFAAAVTGVDLKRPVDAATLAELQHAFDRHAVVVFPGQFIDDESQMAFSRLFGPLELMPRVPGKPPRLAHRELFDVSNLDEHGRITPETDERRIYNLGNRLWHTDGSFRKIGAKYSLLSAHIVPPAGADTEFADMRAAWDALPAATKKRIDGRIAEHSIWTSRAKLGGYVPTPQELGARPPARHPLVRVHPGSKRKTLYIADHVSHIVGMPLDESQALLRELIEFATRPEFVYAHRWMPGDIVLWDNRCTMHRATPFDDTAHPRDMRRTTALDIEEPGEWVTEPVVAEAAIS